MKSLLTLLACVQIQLWAIVATAQTALLSGHIDPDPDWAQTIYLCKIPGYGTLFSGYDGLIVDSATLAPDGAFAFSVHAEAPAIYRLNIPQVGDAAKAGMYFGLPFENYIHLVLEPGARIYIRSKADQLTQHGQITGSSDNLAMQAVRDLRTPMLKQVPQIMEAMARAQQEAPETVEQVQRNAMQQMRLAAEDVQRQLENFLDSTTSLYAGLLAAAYYRLDDNYARYLPTYERVTPKWLQVHGENTYLTGLLTEMDEFKNFLPIGSVAPDIELPDPKGKRRSLHQVKAKLILIDFWASWCSPCRVENRSTVLPLYQKYRDAGFEVFAVSLDTDRDKWLQAINKDGYSWLHVSDLKKLTTNDIGSKYQINAIPTTYLIGEDKRIVAKNLKNNDLAQFVERYFDR